ncbi:MAG: nucleotide-diphospho-sugar transferase [Cyclobacteriaceae bacterium]
MAFATPILFIVFNRPNHTRKVLERIREIKPNFLFVAADGPRRSHVGDADKCNEVREIIKRGIDWPCEIKTQFRDENLGCGIGPAQAITWFFDNVEEGIILEDDCLPGISFFNFCSTLLNYYRNDEQIMHIGGSNFQNQKKKVDYSYYFSAYSHNWGWATWKNRWRKYNYSIGNLDRAKLSGDLIKYGLNKVEIEFWVKVFEEVSKAKTFVTWDYQWLFAIWTNHCLSIVPSVNLVRNIGFDEEGTRTREAHSYLSIPVDCISNVKHPPTRIINFKADHYTFDYCYLMKPTYLNRIISFLSYLLKNFDKWLYLKKIKIVLSRLDRKG